MGYGGKYCFDAEAFAEPAFDLASFLEECRARHPMETIHQDLKQFQTALENQARQPFVHRSMSHVEANALFAGSGV